MECVGRKLCGKNRDGTKYRIPIETRQQGESNWGKTGVINRKDYM